MKKINLITALLLLAGVAFAQSEEKKGVKIPIVEQEVLKEASKGGEISEMAVKQEGGKEKGISISSAARKSSLMNGRAVKGGAMSEKGEGKSNNAQSMKGVQPGKPNQTGKPETVVPPAKPTPPVVRPNGPAQNTPKRPAGPPNGIPRGGR